VPYEKGFYLLYHLRSLVGPHRFARFAHDYCQTYKFRSITSDDFQAYFTAYFTEGRYALPAVGHRGVPPMHNGDTSSGFDPAEIPALADPATLGAGVPSTGIADAAVLAAAAADAAAAGLPAIVGGVDWALWYRGQGMPPAVNHYDRSERDAVNALADAWIHRTPDAAAQTPAATAAWAPRHWMAFAERLVEVSGELATRSPPAIIDPATLKAIDAGTRLSASRNSEIRMAWCQLAVRSGLTEVLPAVTAFLTAQGRMKVRVREAGRAATRGRQRQAEQRRWAERQRESERAMK
jgi:hypothetical protein